MTWRLSLDPLVVCALVLTAGTAFAQGLSDPTKPPAGLYGGAGAPRLGEAGDPLVLQSVLIYPDARSAIISGEHVWLGQKLDGGMRLVKVAETEVVLLDGAQRRTLKLFPGAEKRPVAGVQHRATPNP
jgi:MSHA biogenesis protein MshK